MLNERWQQAALLSLNRKRAGEDGGAVRARASQRLVRLPPRSLTLCNAIAGVHTHAGASVAWPTWGRVWGAVHALTVASHVRRAPRVLPAQGRRVLHVVLFGARVEKQAMCLRLRSEPWLRVRC